MSARFDAVVIGGGPAGSAAARLLALWGHSVLVLTKAPDLTRGAAESLPPSTRKILATVGVLDAVDAEHFYRTTGNTVWWGSREGHAERFDASADAAGYQVFRPAFDRVLLRSAAEAGAEVIDDAHVRRVHVGGEGDAVVDFTRAGAAAASVACSFAVDASGRAGIIARRGFRRHQSGFLTQAFIGEWQQRHDWALPDPSHTLVETYEHGWAWSVPLSATVRQVGVAVDGAATRGRRGPTLQRTYYSEIAQTRQLKTLIADATLGRVWACDASLYSSDIFADRNFVLLGDAASAIDPLSSFGVKKALASAWVGAVAIHTTLTDPDRHAVALDFFSTRERQVYGANLRRSCAFAREAYERHPRPFWAERAQPVVDPPDELDENALLRSPDVEAAFRRLKESAAIELSFPAAAAVTKRALIIGREIVVADAVALPDVPEGVRFLAGVDLVKLGALAPHYRQVPDLYDAYCNACGPVPLPSLLGSLSVLLAKGVLKPR